MTIKKPINVVDISTWVTKKQRLVTGRKIAEYFESGQINRDVREKHFSAGLPVTYMSDDDNTMVREHSDGRIETVMV